MCTRVCACVCACINVCVCSCVCIVHVCLCACGGGCLLLKWETVSCCLLYLLWTGWSFNPKLITVIKCHLKAEHRAPSYSWGLIFARLRSGFDARWFHDSCIRDRVWQLTLQMTDLMMMLMLFQRNQSLVRTLRWHAPSTSLGTNFWWAGLSQCLLIECPVTESVIVS